MSLLALVHARREAMARAIGYDEKFRLDWSVLSAEDQDMSWRTCWPRLESSDSLRNRRLRIGQRLGGRGERASPDDLPKQLKSSRTEH